MLRDLLGEGALSSIVVSRLGAVEVNQGKKRVQELVRRLFGFWLCALILVAVLGILCSPFIVMAMASGFARSPEKLALSIELTRLIFPFITFVGMSALTMGVLHHLKVFGWSTSASSFLNLSVILSLIAFYFLLGPEPSRMVYAVALAMLFGGFVQWLSMLPGFRRSGVSLIPSNPILAWREDAEVRKIFWLLGPAILGVASVQINVMVNHSFATWLDEASVTFIYYAFRVMQLPVGIVGVAVSTVLLPTLTKLHAENNKKEFSSELSQALLSVSFLTVPAIAGLYVLGKDLISFLYEHGRFDNRGTLGVWSALLGYLPGILPYVYNKNLTQAYYAKSDMKYPVTISMISIFLNALINYTFVFVFDWGVFGLTLGTSVVLMVNSILLFLGLLFKYKYQFFWKELVFKMLWILLASFAMIVFLKELELWISGNFLVLKVLLPTALGIIFYFLIYFSLKVFLKLDLRKIASFNN